VQGERIIYTGFGGYELYPQKGPAEKAHAPRVFNHDGRRGDIMGRKLKKPQVRIAKNESGTFDLTVRGVGGQGRAELFKGLTKEELKQQLQSAAVRREWVTARADKDYVEG